MTSVWTQLEQHLAQVEKPARYIGLELGAQRPTHAPHVVSWLLTYPDTYEIGLPNQGLQILYEILNERDAAAAERAYSPWGDMEAVMRRERIPLFSVDTHKPAGEFDVLAFNLSAELTYTNLLNCVDLAGVPVRADDRRPRPVAVPPQPTGPTHRGGPRPAQRGGVPGLHPGLPLLPGGDDHAAGARAAGRPGPHDGAGGPPPHGLRRGGADKPVDGRLLRHRDDGEGHRRRPVPVRPGVGEPAQPAGRRLRGGHRQPDPEGAAHRPHVRPRGGHVAYAAGDQQAHPRGGPVLGGRRRLRQRLAPGEAVIPPGAAPRDRRGKHRDQRN